LARWSRPERYREFADSPLEEKGFELMVPSRTDDRLRPGTSPLDDPGVELLA
jgi:hypothetical protein